MNVPFQVNVPIDMAADLRGKLVRLKEQHESEIARMEKSLKSSGNTKLIAKLAGLAERGRRLTVHNMVRLALTHGLVNLVKKTDEQVLALLAEEGTVRGRPRAAV